MTPAELEALVDRQLRQLRPPQAPATLLPRVMASVQGWRTRPWYARAWVTWPAGWQIASVAVLLLIVAAATVLLPPAMAGVAGATWSRTGGVASEATRIVRHVELTASALGILWRTVVQPLVPYLFGVAVLMWLSCVALGAALTRVVPREVFQR